MKISCQLLFWNCFLIVIDSFLTKSDAYIYSCNSSVSCGCSSNPVVSGRIVGGEEAADDTWSWTVSIKIGLSSLCAGSILSSEWIISAAHCFDQVDPNNVKVYVGSKTRWFGLGQDVMNIILHPFYNQLQFQNDIALLRLTTPLNMTSPTVKRICISNSNTTSISHDELWLPPGSNVMAVGWGKLSEFGLLPLKLQQVSLQIIASESPTCLSVIYNKTTQICAGSEREEKDTCNGDSGGPLMMFTTSRQWTLIGLTSYGIGCANSRFSGVYTRVNYYDDWIQSVTNNSSTYATSLNLLHGIPSSSSTMYCDHLNSFTLRISIFSYIIRSLYAYHDEKQRKKKPRKVEV